VCGLVKSRVGRLGYVTKKKLIETYIERTRETVNQNEWFGDVLLRPNVNGVVLAVARETYKK